MGELNVLDRTGDTRIQWDKMNESEVAAAEKRFKEFKAKGYLAYKVGAEQEVLHKFDPTAERIIFSPPAQGG